MLKWKSLTLSAFVALAVTGAQGCIGVVSVDDDGDGSGEGEGEGEGEEVTLLGVGEACNLTRTDEICDETQNLTCVQQGLNPNAGVCRPLCGSFDAQGQAAKDPAVTCPSGTACQAIISADLTSGSVVCAPQGDINEPCRGLGDPESCTEGECVILDFTANDAGTQIETVDALGCRAACDAAGEGDECGTGEACLRAGRLGFRSDFEDQVDAQGNPVTCTEAQCDAGNEACPCDEGFECTTFGSGANAESVCSTLRGMCLVPVAPFTTPIQNSSQLTGAFTPERICNTIDENRACDPRFFDGVSNPGSNECIRGLFEGNDGFCYAVCSTPTVDDDRNGTIAAGEQGADFGCPENYACSLSFGRLIGLAAFINDPATNEPKVCNPASCTAGQPCPGECGIGDAECVTFGTGAQAESVCAAPFGNCVEVPAACGDGVKNGTDQCDGTDLGGATCPANTTGTVTCNAACELVTTGCAANPRCGDGVKNGADQCDGTDLGDATCPEGTTGTVTCNASCELVTTGCAANPRCGDGVLNGDDECDGDDLGDATCPAGTSGTVSCNDDCEIVTTGCTPDPICGDDVKNGDDECDGDDLGGASCPTGTSGVVSCSVDCEIDETQCVPNCGNGRLDDGEACDGDNIGTELCPLGTTGTPGCTENCAIDIGPPNCNPVLPDP